MKAKQCRQLECIQLSRWVHLLERKKKVNKAVLLPLGGGIVSFITYRMKYHDKIIISFIQEKSRPDYFIQTKPLKVQDLFNYWAAKGVNRLQPLNENIYQLYCINSWISSHNYKVEGNYRHLDLFPLCMKISVDSCSTAGGGTAVKLWIVSGCFGLLCVLEPMNQHVFRPSQALWINVLICDIL